MATVIQLTAYEYIGAAHVGLLRFYTSCAAGMNDATTYKRPWLERLVDEVVGAGGERAFCKVAGLYWDGSVNTFHAVPDVDAIWEVRTTLRADGSLIVRDNDDPARRYVLVLAHPPWFKVCGWMHGADAQRSYWQRDPHGHRPSWFVPQAALTDWN